MPDAVLSTLERALAGADEATLHKCTHFVRLLRSLAYDAAYFERALSLLVKFACLSSKDGSESDAMSTVESLFYIVWSGTHAPLTLRLAVVGDLLRCADPAARDVGVMALQAMFKSSHILSAYDCEFGALSRDYGYHPRTKEDVRSWFATVLKGVEPFALSDSTITEPVRKAIAHEFRELWTNYDLADDLERLSRTIAAKHFWREGWIAARQTRVRDGKELSPEIAARLTALEEFLRPKDLVDRVRGLVLDSSGGSYDLDDLDDVEDQDYDGAMERAAATIFGLGREVAADQKAFMVLLPALMNGSGGKVADFGRGIAMTAEKPHEIWNVVVAQMAATVNPSCSLLCGFLEGLQNRDGALVSALLDEALHDATLAEWFPVLQASVLIDGKGLARLIRALEHGRTPVTSYLRLAYGRTCDAMTGPGFKRLVLVIGSKPNGITIALEILYMRLHSDHNAKRKSAPEIAEAGRTLLAAYEFRPELGRHPRVDYRLGVIIRASLAGDDGKPIARRLCRDLIVAGAQNRVFTGDYENLMRALFQVHPINVLDELFSGDQWSHDDGVRLLNGFWPSGKHPIEVVVDDVIIGWCDRDPNTRYPLAAAVALLFKRPSDKAPHEWTNLARQLLLKAPDPEAVFKKVAGRLHPKSWSGSLATKLESRLELLDQLDVGAVPDLAAALDMAKAMLKRQIDVERRHEAEKDCARSGRFE